MALRSGPAVRALRSGAASMALRSGPAVRALRSGAASMALRSGPAVRALRSGAASMALRSGARSMALRSGARSMALRSGARTASSVEARLTSSVPVVRSGARSSRALPRVSTLVRSVSASRLASSERALRPRPRAARRRSARLPPRVSSTPRAPGVSSARRRRKGSLAPPRPLRPRRCWPLRRARARCSLMARLEVLASSRTRAWSYLARPPPPACASSAPGRHRARPRSSATMDFPPMGGLSLPGACQVEHASKSRAFSYLRRPPVTSRPAFDRLLLSPGRGSRRVDHSSSAVNQTTWRMLAAPVSSMTRRSNPRALPAEGGRPSSRAARSFSSTG